MSKNSNIKLQRNAIALEVYLLSVFAFVPERLVLCLRRGLQWISGALCESITSLHNTFHVSRDYTL